jgi:hypothetical protein
MSISTTAAAEPLDRGLGLVEHGQRLRAGVGAGAVDPQPDPLAPQAARAQALEQVDV